MFIYENSKDQILDENGENCSKRDTGRFFRGCEGCYPLVQSLWEGSPGYPIY